MPQPPAPLAVSMGDPAGIGLDIIMAAVTGPERTTLPEFVVYGSAEALAERAKDLGIIIDLCRFTDLRGAVEGRPSGLPVVDIPLTTPAIAGQPDSRNAPAIIGAIERATADVAVGLASAVVTCPIAKATLTAAGFKHPGHTEFLAELAKRHVPSRAWVPVMMLGSDALRVVPVTIHIPLARVPAALTQVLIETTIRITASDLKRWFGVSSPRIAVAGLNPHAGESGTLGREEIEIIRPAIEALRAEGHDIAGPLSADTMFHAGARARYDVAICMYHDQALIPIKTLAFDSGVNVTLGLPFVRTSPDHGTAFDIAGTGKANPESFIAALRMAAEMASRGRVPA